MSEYDLVIRGAAIVDGAGAERFRAGVAIVGDRIAKVGLVTTRGGCGS